MSSGNQSLDVTLLMEPHTNTTNGSLLNGGGNYIEPQPFRWALRLIFISVFLVGSVGNLVVCSAIIRRKRMRTSNNIFTFNLAVSDLMIVLIYVPTQMAAFENNHNWPLGNFVCHVAYVLIPVCLSASIATLLAITSDRYRAIAYPMRPKLGSKSIRRILMSIWVVSLLVALPLVFVAGTVQPAPGQVYCDESWPDGPYSKIYWIAIFVIQYVLPLCIIWVLAVLIALKLRKNSLKMMMKTSSILATAVRHRMKQSSKITNMLIALVTLYAVCMLPQHVVYLLAIYGDLNQFKYRVYVIRFANVFPMANSALNPIAYGTLNKEFKAVFKNFFKCKCHNDHVDETSQGENTFARGRRFRLAVYRHVDDEGKTAADYARKWRRKSSATTSSSGQTFVEFFQRKRSTPDRKQSGSATTRKVTLNNTISNKPTDLVNNNSCENVTNSVIKLMDEAQIDGVPMQIKSTSPAIKDTLLTIQEEPVLGLNTCSSEESPQTTCIAEKRPSLCKMKNFDVSICADSEMKQCLLYSQSSSDSNNTHDSTQINSCTSQEESLYTSTSLSLEWEHMLVTPSVVLEETLKTSQAIAGCKTSEQNQSKLQRQPNCAVSLDDEHTFSSSSFSNPYNPVCEFVKKQLQSQATKTFPCNAQEPPEHPDTFSNPSAPALNSEKFDIDLCCLIESARETTV